MNKWQIICPGVLLLVVGLWAGLEHGRSQQRGMRAAVERHLESVLAELEKHQNNGRFPTVDVARTVLNDEAIEKRVHVTSLFATRDLLYNPSQPAVGSDAAVLCARIGQRSFDI